MRLKGKHTGTRRSSSHWLRTTVQGSVLPLPLPPLLPGRPAPAGWGGGGGSSAEGRRAPQPRGFPDCYRPAPRAASAAHADSHSACRAWRRDVRRPARFQGTLPGLRGAAERADSRSRYVSGEPGRAGRGGQARAAAAAAAAPARARLWRGSRTAARAPAEDFTPGLAAGADFDLYGFMVLRGCDL